MKKCKECQEEKDYEMFHKQCSYSDGYRNVCKECRKIESKIFYAENSERIKHNTKQYAQENKEKIKRYKQEYNRKYREHNKDYHHNYWNKNKVELNKKIKHRVNSSPVKRIIRNCRSRIREFVKQKFFSKTRNSIKMIGCSPQELRKHLESKFLPGMTWDNYGLHGWHIDHIIPVSIANTPEEAIKLCHYTNLQPLWAKDNLSKGNRI